jgi:hypothetical protein
VQGNTVQGRIHWWESNRAVPRLLSGIEAGVVGGVAMLALLVSGSLWRGDPWWMPSNLLGSTFYGARALSAGPDRSTLAGLIWQGLANAVLWPSINPLIPLYSPQPATFFSHALFGASLGYLAGFRDRPPAAPQPEAPGKQDGVE